MSGGNHYSRSVATLEAIVESKLRQLRIVQKENDRLRAKEHALMNASATLAGGVQAGCSIITATSFSDGSSSPSYSHEGPASPRSSSFTSYSCCGIADSHALQQKMDEREQQVQQMLQQMGCDSYDELYSTSLLRRAATKPARAVAHLAATLPERLAGVARMVQKFGILVPKYDTAKIATSVGTAKQQLDHLVDELSERILVCGLLDPPERQMEEHMINMETGLSEQYPESWWNIVVEAMELTAEQKAALKICWDKVKVQKTALTEQHQQLAARLAELQKQQHERQRIFGQQANSVYRAVHQEQEALLQLQLEAELANDQPALLTPLEQQLEQQLQAELLSSCQQQQQQHQHVLQLGGESLQLDHEMSYPALTGAGLAETSAALLDTFAECWPPTGTSPEAQPQLQQPQLQQRRVHFAPPQPPSGSPLATAAQLQQAILQLQAATVVVKTELDATAMDYKLDPDLLPAKSCGSVTGCSTRVVFNDTTPLPLVAGSSGSVTASQGTCASPAMGSSLTAGRASSATAAAAAGQPAAAAAARGFGAPGFGNGVAQVFGAMPEPLPQQQQQQPQLVQAEDVELPDDVEPQRAISNTLARCTSQAQRELLLQVCSKEQQEVELELEKVRAQLKMQNFCMAMHIHNVCTKKQLALGYLNCYPFVPEAFSLCEALDEMGW